MRTSLCGVAQTHETHFHHLILLCDSSGPGTETAADFFRARAALGSRRTVGRCPRSAGTSGSLGMPAVLEAGTPTRQESYAAMHERHCCADKSVARQRHADEQ